jgi:hypothetical protein
MPINIQPENEKKDMHRYFIIKAVQMGNEQVKRR